MTKPLSRQEMDTFLGTICHSIETEPPSDEFGMIVAVWEPDIVVMCALGANDPAGQAQVDQMLATRPPAVGAAIRTSWTNDPDPSVPTLPSWIVITITPGRIARFVVKQDVGENWYTITPPHAPWFALSTASSLRAALETGQTMHFKATHDPALFKAPGEGPVPIVDEHGRI